MKVTKIKHHVVYKARVANRTIKVIYRRMFSSFASMDHVRDEFSVQITGGGWQLGTLFSEGLNNKLAYMRKTVLAEHPRAKWYVLVDNTGRIPRHDNRRRKMPHVITL